MKESYISPEAKILCFAPVEHLANTPMEDYAEKIGARDVEVDVEISGVEKP